MDNLYHFTGDKEIVAQQINALDRVDSPLIKCKWDLAGDTLVKQNVKQVTAIMLNLPVAGYLKFHIDPRQRQNFTVCDGFRKSCGCSLKHKLIGKFYADR